MEINRKNALQFWEAIYGQQVLVQDCFGTWIYKEDFGDSNTMRKIQGTNTSYNYGWTIDHILPLSKNGTDANNNLEPMHVENNAIKADCTSFMIDNVEYEVIKCKMSVDGYKGYGIRNKMTKERVDWKYKYNKYF